MDGTGPGPPRINQGFCPETKEMVSQLQIDICALEEFKEYAEKAKSLLPSTEDANNLVLYGLYKQSTAGDVILADQGSSALRKEPSGMAWKTFEKKSKDEAMHEYINKVKQLQEQTSTK